MSEYTTVALLDADKSRLDGIETQHMNDGNNSYRDVINFLADAYVERQDDYEYVLAKAIANADESDAKRVISRVNADKNFVEGINDE